MNGICCSTNAADSIGSSPSSISFAAAATLSNDATEADTTSVGSLTTVAGGASAFWAGAGGTAAAGNSSSRRINVPPARRLRGMNRSFQNAPPTGDEEFPRFAARIPMHRPGGSHRAEKREGFDEPALLATLLAIEVFVF